MLVHESIGFRCQSAAGVLVPMTPKLTDDNRIRKFKFIQGARQTGARIESLWVTNPTVFDTNPQLQFATQMLGDVTKGNVYQIGKSNNIFCDVFKDTLPLIQSEVLNLQLQDVGGGNVYTAFVNVSYDNVDNVNTRFVSIDQLNGYSKNIPFNRVVLLPASTALDYTWTDCRLVLTDIDRLGLYAIRGASMGVDVVNDITQLPTLTLYGQPTGWKKVSVPLYGTFEQTKDYFLTMNKLTGRKTIPVFTGEELINSKLALTWFGGTYPVEFCTYKLL